MKQKAGMQRNFSNKNRSRKSKLSVVMPDTLRREFLFCRQIIYHNEKNVWKAMLTAA